MHHRTDAPVGDIIHDDRFPPHVPLPVWCFCNNIEERDWSTPDTFVVSASSHQQRGVNSVFFYRSTGITLSEFELHCVCVLSLSDLTRPIVRIAVRVSISTRWVGHSFVLRSFGADAVPIPVRLIRRTAA